MHIPDLLSPFKPAAPSWGYPDLDEGEQKGILQSVVMLVGHNRGQVRALGSGFMIAPGIVATAAHTLVDWVNEVAPQPFAMMPGPLDLDDFSKRSTRVFNAGALKALIQFPAPLGHRICDVQWWNVVADPLRCDLALLGVVLPDEATAEEVTCLPIDMGGFPASSPIVVAGYTSGKFDAVTSTPVARSRINVRQHLALRTGRIYDCSEAPAPFKTGRMFRAAIPSLPGMSGGPAILDRNNLPRSVLVTTVAAPVHLAAVGIVSRSRLGSPFLLDSCEEDTWITPIAGLLDMAIPARDGDITLRSAIDSGQVFMPQPR